MEIISLSVSDLNQLVQQTLEQAFPPLWLRGEVSNFTKASSGHWYFLLKDKEAQVRCTMFKNRSQYLDWQPNNGDMVTAYARVSLYKERGEFQLNIETLNHSGLGNLFEAFEALKKKLKIEGLFDNEYKKALPRFPKIVGVITSIEAAAWQDVQITLKRRLPSIAIVLYPTPVQGKGSAEKIAKAINFANWENSCDVLILCRGGGSIEDLWAFNEEIVARSIFKSQIPIVSGIGHETDFTIADFVADVRAATPTASAELVVPDTVTLKETVAQYQMRLLNFLHSMMNDRGQKLDYLAQRFAVASQLLIRQKERLVEQKARLITAWENNQQNYQIQLNSLEKQLNLLAPQNALSRGYAWVQNEKGGIIYSAEQLKTDDQVKLTFAIGEKNALIL